MNFLISEGHTFASRYPIGRVWTEVEITRRRVNARIANDAALNQLALGTIYGGKKGYENFKRSIKALNDGGT